LLLLLLAALVGCRAQQPPAATPAQPQGPAPTVSKTLEGKTILMVVAPKDFRDDEYTTPRSMFDAEGATVTVASTRRGTAVGVGGTQVPVDLVASEAKGSDYDAVVFVGGPGMVPYLDNAEFVRLAKESAAAGKVTAAICVAPTILANAGLLKGVQATAWESEHPKLKAAGATISPHNTVRSGKIITANGPEAARDFATLIIHSL